MLKIEWLYVGVITPNPTAWNTKQSEIQSSVAEIDVTGGKFSSDLTGAARM